MKRFLALAALSLPLAATAQESEPSATPSSVVAAAKAEEWVAISPEDLLVMELTPDARGNPRTVVIQLAPEPFSQPWVDNIRTLASAHWWDSASVYRVQDNYVTQWGDVTEEKQLPEGVVSPDAGYASVLPPAPIMNEPVFPLTGVLRNAWLEQYARDGMILDEDTIREAIARQKGDSYASETAIIAGWPVGIGPDEAQRTIAWPIHCYSYIGVARGYAPDTGTGAELYTIIGQPQRHMDRNLAVVGRVIMGMEHLSSLPRGSGELGFYTEEEADLRTPILSVRLAKEMDAPPAFQYLDTSSESFARYVGVGANRDDAFYTQPAGGVDVCSVQVPVRMIGE
ncbi:peptidylprolyl isomerase [Aurantiacibacter rhizosphaerae]|uniref:Peptidylprolyl isomerase n=1 Tax=Aurantiacibacter rhizosphaerae TaxID=2691582 RepID=A0A844XHK5_9SPHN|nr:peptidylprolyl isomerase [Aurantiacibacter rhizosphaerae]MWV29219.1 peptidylprolyl isomerase [Aurantiacibacter rhizosphaerae]